MAKEAAHLKEGLPRRAARAPRPDSATGPLPLLTSPTTQNLQNLQTPGTPTLQSALTMKPKYATWPGLSQVIILILILIRTFPQELNLTLGLVPATRPTPQTRPMMRTWTIRTLKTFHGFM